ncbi:MAG: histidinol dehydrogenase [Dehalococcoidia bacterium]|nr:Histidinol dehydrogenase [Chloroflexota bacterium]MBT9160644.1 Histidinol dehydrogenase [Chloroflexota bacterium]MBT9162519.1 Histidinol dehydrogenase [Chloroflexota bacterium]
MRVIQDIELAKSTLLKRLPAESVKLPLERIKETFGKELTPEEAVRQIITDVRDRGDAALLDYAERLEGAKLTRLEVSRKEITAARNNVDEELLAALQTAAERIRDFHQKQRDLLPTGQIDLGEGLGQVISPLERVGIYAPGGTASYPSTVLMTAIPARVAGVDEIILATPPRPDGHIPPLTLAAADISGADRVFAVGGAQAIAALAFGTESIPRVDKICGPGNIFVILAKKQVFGAVGIDGLQGPTETIVLADDCANPGSCAADLLAQAEHDELATAIMITTSPELAHEVNVEVERQLVELERRKIAERSLEQRGGIIVVSGMDEAVELVNAYAPEHLCLIVRDAESVVARIRNAGGIFIGESSPEVVGDYAAGPSHVMPTGGTARFSSPLSVTDFLKITSLVALDKKTLKKLGPHAAAIARAEGLTAHAAAVERRMRDA